ncbi:MAG: SprT-like domain-containing protein [Muribaculaceae bacterium]|nr:SprT-like domain-containing protein [Muribaculaceae bacterium]
MDIDLKYLKERHKYWIEKIGEKGIWDPSLFKPVTICIRPKCRSYHGMFKRKTVIFHGEKHCFDKINLYRNTDDFDPVFVDSVLVHEMIHQYIIQNELNDRSAHGPLFRNFMKEINREFPGTLDLSISVRSKK